MNKTGGLQPALLSHSECIIRPQAERWMRLRARARAQRRPRQQSMSRRSSSNCWGAPDWDDPLVRGIPDLLALGGLWRPRLPHPTPRGPSVMSPILSQARLGHRSDVRDGGVWCAHIRNNFPTTRTLWLQIWENPYHLSGALPPVPRCVCSSDGTRQRDVAIVPDPVRTQRALMALVEGCPR